MCAVYDSKDIGWFVVFVARNKAVSLFDALVRRIYYKLGAHTHITFLGCQSMTVFLR